MPQYLYHILETRPELLSEGLNPYERQAMSDHFHDLERLRDAGKLILAGRTQNTDPTNFGLGIFEASSDAEAEEIVRPELFPYRVALISEANVHDE